MSICQRVGGLLCVATFFWGSAALAVQPVEITDAFTTDAEAHDQVITPHQHLVVLGVNFLNGGDIELTLGTFSLVVISQTDTEVVAELPSIVAPGSYQLTATTGGGTVRHDDFDGVTIGAVGPEGPQGPQGAEGPPGPAGQDGATGQDGAPGADGSSCSASQGIGSATVSCTDGTSATVFDGAKGTDGLPGTPGADGEDGQDGTPCSVTKTADTATIDCASNGIVNVYDGAPGPEGPPGPQGEQGPAVKTYRLRALLDVPAIGLSTSPAPSYLVAEVSCDLEDTILSGGFVFGPDQNIESSYPGRDSWVFRVANYAESESGAFLYILCLDAAEPSETRDVTTSCTLTASLPNAQVWQCN